MKKIKTISQQEDFWLGKFGDGYSARNDSDELLSSKINLFSKILSKTSNIKSVIEYGPNIGFNLLAIQTLIPKINLTSVEINKNACKKLEKIKKNKVINKSILDFKTVNKFDFTLIMTVLIHINPNLLDNVYQIIYKHAKKYICIVEYYNPTPVEVVYRGHKDKLFKRDFAGEMLNKYKNLKLVDYGFVYKRDNNFPYDDVNWFLLEKI